MKLPQGKDKPQVYSLLNEVRKRPRHGVGENCIVNPCGPIIQRPSNSGVFDGSGPYNNDTDYINDYWKLYSDGNDRADISYDSTKDAIKIDFQAANQVMIGQSVLADDSFDYASDTASISVELEASTTMSVRFAILEWTSTADAITNDIVSVWAEDITWVANITEAGITDVISVGTTNKRYELPNISISSSMNNLILVVYASTAPAANDVLYVRKAKVELNSVCTPFNKREKKAEVDLCKYLYSQRLIAIKALARTNPSNYLLGLIFDYATKRTSSPTVTAGAYTVYEEGANVNQQASYTKQVFATTDHTGFIQVYKAIGGSKPSYLAVTVEIDDAI